MEASLLKSNNMTIDYDQFIKLQEHYEKALEDGKVSFIFNGQELLTEYVYYLIEYLKQKFE